MSESIGTEQGAAYVDEHYRKVAARWRTRVTDSPFMRQLRAGTLPMETLRLFLEYCGLSAVDQHGVCLQAAFEAADKSK